MIAPHILIVDDDPDVHRMLRVMLGTKKWMTEFAHDGEEALELLSIASFDVAVIDLYIPKLNGLEVLQTIQKKDIQVNVIMMTGYSTMAGTLQKAIEAMKVGAADFIEKPFRKEVFVHAVEILLKKNNPFYPSLADQLDTFVKEHYFQPLKLKDVCQHFRISRGYVCKLFKECVGVSFQKRLIYYRIQNAKILLESTNAPLYRIAKQCGFRNYRRLTEAFHKLEGVPPKKYRQICTI